MPKTVKKTTKKISHHPEARGIVLIMVGFFLSLCLLSFHDGHHESNWFGIVGHLTSFAFHYLFGLGSFLIAGFLSWLGWQLLRGKSRNEIPAKCIYFFIFICSICILLNVIAETKWIDLSFLESHVIYESVVINAPFPLRYVRYNMGGIPFYYIYRDLPNLNLQHLLSDFGSFITFSLISIVTFIMLSNLSFLRSLLALKRLPPFVFKLSIEALRKFLRFIQKIAPKKPIQPDAIETSVPMVNRHTAPYRPSVTPRPIKPQQIEPGEANFEEVQFEEPVVQKIQIAAISHKPQEKKQSIVEKFLEKKIKYGDSSNYSPPPITLLTDAKKVDQTGLKNELKNRALILEETLLSFGIEAKVGHIYCGPTVTLFEVHPAIGVKVQKIKSLENDIALNLQAKSMRIIAPIPGKAAVGVEIPSLFPQEVGFKEMLTTYQKSEGKFHIPMLLGKTVSGEEVICDLTKMPHCIIAGATGSGKSVCINTIIMSILMNLGPEEVKLILIDPKKVELTPFSKLPHLIAPVITEPSGAYSALQWIVKEMQYRYELLKRIGMRNIHAFNQRTADKAFEESLEMPVPDKLYYIVCIIDEFADLMMTSSSDLETPIARIAQMARAVGIHLILATQRPSREVITGLIKANFPTRIAFKVSSRINSQIILDENGAESLLGNGDMLFLPPGTSQLIRCQGVFIRDEDISRIVEHITSRMGTNYLFNSFDNHSSDDGDNIGDDEPKDEMYERAVQTVLDHKTASTTFLQRKLKIGYARAASLIDELEQNGVISPQDGSRPRKILRDM